MVTVGAGSNNRHRSRVHRPALPTLQQSLIIDINKLQPVIFEAIANLKRGDISNPVTTEIGSHFLMVNDISPAKVTPLEDVQDAIAVSLRNEWKVAKQQELIAQLMTLVKVNSAE